LIVGSVQGRRIRGFNEWGRSLGSHPDNGLRPVFGVVRRQANIRPQLVPALLCKPGAEGILDLDETVVDEVLDLTGRQANLFGLGHCTFSARLPHQAQPVDPIGADAPERLFAVQISGKNVDVNIMIDTYSAAECGIKTRPPLGECMPSVGSLSLCDEAAASSCARHGQG
jgi:hypothetical protein